MKNVSFYPMNALIKGSPSAISIALQSSDLPTFTLDPSSTYKPEQADSNDQSIKTAKVVFEMYNGFYMKAKEFSLGKNPSIKFLILASGGSAISSDGTYFIFKDFSETTPSTMLHEKYVNPHMEEFEGQYEVIEQVWYSFLDHEWQYGFEDLFNWRNWLLSV